MVSIQLSSRHLTGLLAGAACGIAMPVAAQDENGETSNDTGDAVSTEGNGQTYSPGYFEQFAPRNALDMVRRIPGFTINDGNRGQRGLGEANQNVVVNGERLSSKSDSVEDQLQRIPAADVERIEIVDGTTLNVAGLSGQVANIIYTNTGTSGQFEWNTGFRAHNTEAQLYGGEISVTGKSGELDYTVALSNPNNRFGADGPTLITDANGALIEEEYSKFSGKVDRPRLAANFTYDFSEDVVANLNLSYRIDYVRNRSPETGTPVSGPIRTRTSFVKNFGPSFEFGGDIEFPLGPGKLKLIGLDRLERDNFEAELIDRFDDGSAAAGSFFSQVNETGERIGRFEYRWPMLGGDWQISGEAAFNKLDRTSRLFELDINEAFSELDFPAGTGGVTEDRYETILSYSSELTPKLSLQASLGGEYSKIEQTGVAANSRSFQRPKGHVSLTWKPEDGLDMTFEVRRRVGQLSFGDFLASVSLNDENQNGGNNELQPDQSWNFDFELNKTLGDWGSTKLEIRHAKFEDFIDFFPLADGLSEGRGNIGDAERTHIELNTTLKGEPIGWNGAELEIRAIKRWMSVIDPFTGQSRSFSRDLKSLLNLRLRHDIPGSDWAWGSGLFTEENVPYSRLFEVGRDYEGPTFMNLFIEHKDVFGLTVRALYGNVLGARNKFDRTVFDGPRPDSPILFIENRDRRIGPIFRFRVSGNF